MTDRRTRELERRAAQGGFEDRVAWLLHRSRGESLLTAACEGCAGAPWVGKDLSVKSCPRCGARQPSRVMVSWWDRLRLAGFCGSSEALAVLGLEESREGILLPRPHGSRVFYVPGETVQESGLVVPRDLGDWPGSLAQLTRGVYGVVLRAAVAASAVAREATCYRAALVTPEEDERVPCQRTRCAAIRLAEVAALAWLEEPTADRRREFSDAATAHPPGAWRTLLYSGPQDAVLSAQRAVERARGHEEPMPSVRPACEAVLIAWALG